MSSLWARLYSGGLFKSTLAISVLATSESAPALIHHSPVPCRMLSLRRAHRIHHHHFPSGHSNFTTPVWRTEGVASLNISLASGQPPLDLGLGTDYAAMRYSGAGNLSTTAVVSIGSALDACNASKYAGVAGAVVLVPETAPCTLYNASLLAEDAKAAGVLVYRTSGPGVPSSRIRTNIWLPSDRFVAIPVFGVTHVVGQLLLAATAAGATASMALSATSRVIPCTSVVAETTHGHADAVIAIGAHLDSVIAGPGINDDGTGTVAVLSMAKTIIQHEVRPENRLRFFWWGAEEEGLVGSRAYIHALEANDPEGLAEIRAYINLDMLGSPNFVVGVYDGETAPPGARNGSRSIEAMFTKYYTTHGVPYILLPFSTTGGSDYFGFMHAGEGALVVDWEKDVGALDPRDMTLTIVSFANPNISPAAW